MHATSWRKGSLSVCHSTKSEWILLLLQIIWQAAQHKTESSLFISHRADAIFSMDMEILHLALSICCYFFKKHPPPPNLGRNLWSTSCLCNNAGANEQNNSRLLGEAGWRCSVPITSGNFTQPISHSSLMLFSGWSEKEGLKAVIACTDYHAGLWNLAVCSLKCDD